MLRYILLIERKRREQLMNIADLNIILFRAINNLGINHSFMNPVYKFFAEYTVVILMIGVLAYWFPRKQVYRIMTINAGISFILAEMIGKLAGLIYSNKQPFAELANVNQLIDKTVDNSFPSDHTILLFAICFSIWIVRRTQGLLWLTLAAATAISRIGVGVHYPFDVIVGALIAITSGLFINWLNTKLYFSNKILSIYEKIEHSLLPAKKQSKGV